MISIFYSKSKNQFIKSTKSENGKVSTEIVSYDKLKDYKDMIIIKNSFNFDANLEAYKDVFGIETDNALAAQASTCFWDMFEYDEKAEKKFNQISAGTKLTETQKNKSIITVNELMKVKHANDECEMIPLMGKKESLNPKDITDAFSGYSKNAVMNYIKYLEKSFKDEFSKEFWDEIDKYVEEIRKEITEALFPDDESKNKKVEKTEENKLEENNAEEGVNDDACNSQFTGVTDEDLKEINSENLTKTSKDRLENSEKVPSLDDILNSECVDNYDDYKHNGVILKNQKNSILRNKDMYSLSIADRLRNLTNNSDYLVHAALKEVAMTSEEVLHRRGILKNGDKMSLMEDRLRLDCNRLFYELIENKLAFSLFEKKACDEFGFKNIICDHYSNGRKYIDFLF